MIEREFIKDKAKQLKIREYVSGILGNAAGVGSIAIEKTPLGEKIVISAVKPGLIIGRAGKTISDLTYSLRTKFGLENPQIEVREVINPMLSATIVAQRIVSSLERFGPARFKAIGHRELQGIMNAGAVGAEIRIGGRGVPSQRAKSWLFYAGHMKKCGDVAMSDVDIAINKANLKSGTVGIQVRIMNPSVRLPDTIIFKEEPKLAQAVAQQAAAPKVAQPAAQPETKVSAEPKAQEAKPAEPASEATAKKRAPRKKAEKTEAPAGEK